MSTTLHLVAAILTWDSLLLRVMAASTQTVGHTASTRTFTAATGAGCNQVMATCLVTRTRPTTRCRHTCQACELRTRSQGRMPTWDCGLTPTRTAMATLGRTTR